MKTLQRYDDDDDKEGSCEECDAARTSNSKRKRRNHDKNESTMRTLGINYDRARFCKDHNFTRTSNETNRERGLHDEESAMKTLNSNLNSNDEGGIFATKVINSPDTVNKNKTKKPRTSYWEHVERKFTNGERKM